MASMTPKMAAVAPMPNASVIAETIVNAGPPPERAQRVARHPERA